MLYNVEFPELAGVEDMKARDESEVYNILKTYIYLNATEGALFTKLQAVAKLIINIPKNKEEGDELVTAAVITRIVH